MDSIIEERVIDLPVSFTLKKQPGGRYQLSLQANEDEDCFNFYDEEQLYMHVDQGVMTFIVSRTQQEPESIKARLKRLLFGPMPQESNTITRSELNWKKHA